MNSVRMEEEMRKQKVVGGQKLGKKILVEDILEIAENYLHAIGCPSLRLFVRLGGGIRFFFFFLSLLYISKIWLGVS